MLTFVGACLCFCVFVDPVIVFLSNEPVTHLICSHVFISLSLSQGGQTVRNPWPIIGGVAKSICKKEDIIM